MSFDASDFLSPDAPDGYYTVWSFLAETEPGTLWLADDPAAAFAPDQDRATAVAADINAPVVTVSIPPALAGSPVEAAGCVCAFPRVVLLLLYP